MPFAVLFVLFVILVLVVKLASRTASQGAGPGSGGLLARGLVLQADSISSETFVGGRRCELRRVRLDVEVAGQAPYEVSTSVAFPRICEGLPGESLDLRVDPSNQTKISVIGPAGALGWVDAAAGIPGQTWAPSPMLGVAGDLPKGCGRAIVLVIGGGLLAASLVSFLADARSHSSEHPAATHTSPPRPAPPPHKPGQHPR